jgi:hypothetical protein
MIKLEAMVERSGQVLLLERVGTKICFVRVHRITKEI